MTETSTVNSGPSGAVWCGVVYCAACDVLTIARRIGSVVVGEAATNSQSPNTSNTSLPTSVTTAELIVMGEVKKVRMFVAGGRKQLSRIL
jgi:hypothetical protein